MKNNTVKKDFSDILVKNNNHIYSKEYQDMKKGNKIITDFPCKQLKIIKDKKNLTLSKLHQLTNVNRGVLERFLDGGRINHIDYRRIINVFPEIEESNIKQGIDVIPYQVFGCLISKGIVRHLFLNEDNKFYFLAHFKKVFPRETLAISNFKSNNIFLCQQRPSLEIWNEENIGFEFLIKTEVACYYGVIQRDQDRFHLVDIIDHMKIDIDDGTPIREVFDLAVKVSTKWSDIKCNDLNSIVRDVDDLQKSAWELKDEIND